MDQPLPTWWTRPCPARVRDTGRQGKCTILEWNCTGSFTRGAAHFIGDQYSLQCCGSGAGSVFGPSGSISATYESGSFYHQAKIARKTLIPIVLWLLYDFLSLENDVNVALKSTVLSKKRRKIFLRSVSWRSLLIRTVLVCHGSAEYKAAHLLESSAGNVETISERLKKPSNFKR